MFPDLMRRDTPDLIVCDTDGTSPAFVDMVRILMQESGADVIFLTSTPFTEQTPELPGVRIHPLQKPIRLDHYRDMVIRIVESKLRHASGQLDPSADWGSSPQFVAESPQMQKIRDFVEQSARSHLPVMIQGEPGTEVEDIARAIHVVSHGHVDSFRIIYCASLPDRTEEDVLFGHLRGLAEHQILPATIYLHNVQEMPQNLQGRLMRMLKLARLPDPLGKNLPTPRFVASIDSPVEQQITPGTLRPDVFHMLNVLSIHIPPLRERKEDIVPLIADRHKRLTNGACPLPHISDDVLRLLTNYPWPGNVLEVENFVASILWSSNKTEVTAQNLPDSILSFLEKSSLAVFSAHAGIPEGVLVPLDVFEACVERNYILAVLAAFKGDKEVAVTRLGTSLATLYRKIPDADQSHDDLTKNTNAIRPEDIVPLKEYVQRQRTGYMARVLEAAQQDKEKTAEILGISVATLYRMLNAPCESSGNW